MNLREYITHIYRAAPAGISLLAFVAGGALRSYFDGTDVKDYDLFFARAGDWELACKWFRSDDWFEEITAAGEELYPSFKRVGYPPFNLIGFRFYPTVRALASSFDFRCCAMAAEMVEPGEIEVFIHHMADADARERVLVILNRQPQARVTRRSDRYIRNYGYRKGLSFDSEFHACRHIHGSAGGY